MRALLRRVLIAYIRASAPYVARPVVVLDTMSDDDWLALADGEILSAALRGLVSR